MCNWFGKYVAAATVLFGDLDIYGLRSRVYLRRAAWHVVDGGKRVLSAQLPGFVSNVLNTLPTKFSRLWAHIRHFARI